MGNKETQEPIKGSSYNIPVLGSTFQVLNELAKNGPQSLTGLTQQTQIPKSTVFRILRTLTDLGYVLRTGSAPKYCLTLKFGELSGAGAWAGTLRQVALPHMLELRRQFGETVNLAQIHLDRVTYLEVAPSDNSLDMNERRGEWVYAHSSALGKALLAFLPPDEAKAILGRGELPKLTSRTTTRPAKLLEELAEVRRNRIAFDDREVNIYGNCVAAPILDDQDRPLAALSVSGPTSRFDARKAKKLIAALKKSAKAIADDFGRAG